MTCATSEGDDFITMPHLNGTRQKKKNSELSLAGRNPIIYRNDYVMIMYQNDSKCTKVTIQH